jgi:glycosidase
MRIETPEWVKDVVFYQIFPDRFARRETGPDTPPLASGVTLDPWGSTPTPHGYQGGNLLGIADHLDYLVDLGVTALYLNPIFSAGSNHRYNTYDYFQIDPLLGDDEAFDHLLAEAHRRDVRIVLDGVFNHTGRGFYPFAHLLEWGPRSPYLDWFTVHDWPLQPYSPGPANYATWEKVTSMPKLNTDAPQVREFICSVATYWLERGIDGWRLDVPYEINDDAFWREFRRRCKVVNPEAYIVGELWFNAERWLAGDQFDGQMNYAFTRAVLGYLAGDALDRSQTRPMGYGECPTLSAAAFGAELDRQFNGLYDAPIVQTQLMMLGSHDTPRLMTLMNEDVAAVKLAFLCQMTVPGAPNIYYGDEIGLTGRTDPYCRGAFPWEEPGTWDSDLLNTVKQLTHLRHRLPALRRGSFEVVATSGPAIVYQRRLGDALAVVALNPGDRDVTLDIPQIAAERLAEERLGNDQGIATESSQGVTVPARNGRLWTTG